MNATIAGLPLTTDTNFEIDAALEKLVADQQAEIVHMGCTPTSVHISNPDTPPRFFFVFAPGIPSFQTRNNLGGKGYDVGQQMGKHQLRFYASKRVTKGNGWEV